MEKARSMYSEINLGRECFQVNYGLNACMLSFSSQILLKQNFKKDIFPQRKNRKEDKSSKLLGARKRMNLADLRKTILK